jgi:signal transduction histidine kinase
MTSSAAIRILMLEESAADAELLETELRRAGLQFVSKRASGQDEFVGALDDFQPQIVLSNYQIEGFDGLTALELVRKKRRDVPFIFVSWTVHEDSVIDAMKRGATDYVFKDQLQRLPLSMIRALRETEERAELRRAQQKAIEQERLGALGQMASGIAHDFSNALTPVLGFSELLIDHPEYWNDKQLLSEYLHMINTSAKDAMHIVGRLREFYRKRQKVEVMLPIDLRQIVEQAVLFTRPKWKDQALAAGVIIRVETELMDLPRVAGNDSALREVLTNLIFNAVDAMPKGGTISFNAYSDQGQVVLEASDTGTGMSEEVRSHCFEPFYSTKGRRGTGLGLAMVYGVVRRHDGTITVESEAGTKFILRLPVYRPSNEKKSDGAADMLPMATAVRPFRVLVVDDEPLVRQVLRDYLCGDGHAVETACSAEEGLAKFSAGTYDVVLTDWAMPGKRGDELTAEIKERSPKTPVIMLTGFGELMKAKGETVPGVDVLLSKPPTLAAVREAVLRVTPLVV